VLFCVGTIFLLIGMWVVSGPSGYGAGLMPTYTRAAPVDLLSLPVVQATALLDLAGDASLLASTVQAKLAASETSTPPVQFSPSPILAGEVDETSNSSISDTQIPSVTPTAVPPTPMPVIVHPTLLPTVISTILPSMTPVFSSGGGNLRWIDVDLTKQILIAYEGDAAVRSTLVSTGLTNTPTPVGVYRIWIKLRYDDMTGPGYYLADVPYTMYFYRGYGIHGTYWHNNFGNPMSHGCVNLPTSEAGWLFEWAEVGTPVNIHY